MSRQVSDGHHGLARFPRVSGDEPVDDMRALKEKMFSPRERG